jgi:hypothetical protein
VAAVATTNATSTVAPDSAHGSPHPTSSHGSRTATWGELMPLQNTTASPPHETGGSVSPHNSIASRTRASSRASNFWIRPHNATVYLSHTSHVQISGTWTKPHSITVSTPHSSVVHASGTWVASGSVTVSAPRQSSVPASVGEIATHNVTAPPTSGLNGTPSIVPTSPTSLGQIPPSFTDGAPF